MANFRACNTEREPVVNVGEAEEAADAKAKVNLASAQPESEKRQEETTQQITWEHRELPTNLIGLPQRQVGSRDYRRGRGQPAPYRARETSRVGQLRLNFTLGCELLRTDAGQPDVRARTVRSARCPR